MRSLFYGQTPLNPKKTKHDIPVPKIKDVETYKTDISATYVCPVSFVRYQRPTQRELKENLEYVIDAEDEVWLLNNTKFGGSVPNTRNNDSRKRRVDDKEERDTCQLPLAMFEIMMDVMEKTTTFDAIITKDYAEHYILNRLPQLYHMYPIKASSGVVKMKDVLQDVYNYWVSKRSKLKRPLLRRFWPVTSSDDTNPHLVFRPREKEKYKLRKKRQNDMDAYRKMQQLKQDFEQVRALLDLVKHREELSRSFVLSQRDWFYQKIYDAVDTSGETRISKEVERERLDKLLEVKNYFELTRSRKSRRGNQSGRASSRSTSPTLDGQTTSGGIRDIFSGGAPEAAPKIIAGQNQGDPAPNFLNPLSTRESYATSWDYTSPHVTTFVDAAPEPTFRFRHRPRVGRGGRLCIDRRPLPVYPNMPPVTYFRAGSASIIPREPKQRLLELLPPPLDHSVLQRKIENICLNALKEDYDTLEKSPSGKAGAPVADTAEENDGDAVVVRLKDWMNTDDQLWGEERFAIGPI
jgi:enhancer of polycomb-like protein